MKKVIIVMLLLGSTFTGFSQTMEEYNYITKGYRTQVIEQGGDIKAGYELSGIDGPISIGDRIAHLYAFKKKDTGKVVAYMIYFKNTSTDFQDYIYVPVFEANKEIRDKFITNLQENYNSDALILITWLLSRNVN